MMTIEKRAKEYLNTHYLATIYDGFVIGAETQQKIDTENGKKFCKAWLDEIIELYLPDLKSEPFYTQALEHTYKKYEQAMEE